MRRLCRLLLGFGAALLLSAAAGGCPAPDPTQPVGVTADPVSPPARPLPPPPADKLPAGFIYRSNTGARRFQIAQGPRDPRLPAIDQRAPDPVFIPLGINYAWPAIPAGALEYRVTLHDLSANGVNLIRVWQSTWGFDLGGWNLDGNLDGPGVKSMDDLFATAEKNHVKILLVYDNHFDVLNNQKKHGLFRASGLPGAVCDSIRDYFQSAAARKIHGARLKAILQRYGASPAFFGLEFFNELDLALPNDLLSSANSRILESWARFMADTVWAERQAGNLNAWHPIGLSTVGTRTLNCYADPRFDWVSVHLYIPEGIYLLRDEQFNEARMAALSSLYYEYFTYLPNTPPIRRTPHRPWIMEYGFSSPNHIAERNFKDPTGRHLRHALWAALAAGGEGAPMPWWWDTYILPNKLYHLYRPLSTAIAGLPWDQLPSRMVVDQPAGTLAQTVAAQEHNQALLAAAPAMPAFQTGFQCYATVWEQAALVYCMRDSAAWSARQTWVQQLQIAGSLRLGLFPPGRYAVEWIDPATGHAAAPNQLIDHPGGALNLTTPPFSDDLAARLHQVPAE